MERPKARAKFLAKLTPNEKWRAQQQELERLQKRVQKRAAVFESMALMDVVHTAALEVKTYNLCGLLQQQLAHGWRPCQRQHSQASLEAASACGGPRRMRSKERGKTIRQITASSTPML